MDAEKAKSYVYYYCENYISLSAIKGLRIVYGFLTYIFIIYGILSDVILPYSIIFLLLTVFYIAAIPVFAKNIRRYDSFPLRFLVNGIEAMFMDLYFLLWLYMPLPNVSESIAVKLILTAIIIVFNMSYIGITVLLVKSGRYLNKKHSYGVIMALGGGVTGSIGMCIARLVSHNVSERTSEIIYKSVLFFIVLILSVGTANFLKYYWCKKYGITCDESGKASSPALYTDIDYGKKKSLPARIAVTVFKVIGILFAMLILVGVYVQNRV